MRSFAIVPAAGRSKRMKEPKLLLPWSDWTVIEQVLSVWKASRVTEVAVVVHPKDHALADICRRSGAETVIASTPPKQMKDSVVLGLAHIEKNFKPNNNDSWLLAPADMPYLSQKIIKQLLAEFKPESSEILVPCFQKKRGHPVLFPWPMSKEVVSLEDDQGINTLLLRHPVREIQCEDSKIMEDMDTPEEYRRLHNR